jgi:hypothetical protein
MDPVARRVARRFRADNHFYTKPDNVLTRDDADASIDRARAVVKGLLDGVIKKIVSSRTTRPLTALRETWREAAEGASHKFEQDFMEALDVGGMPAERARGAYNAARQDVEVAANGVRKLLWNFYDTIDGTLRPLPDGADFAKAVRIAIKAWALDVGAATQKALRAAEKFLGLAVVTPTYNADFRKKFHQPDSFEEFDLHGLRFVVFDPKVSEVIDDYVAGAKEAYAAMAAKRLTGVWYGTVLLKSYDFKKLSPLEIANYRALGYAGLEATAGSYHSGADEVEFTTNPGHFVHTLVHELGHRWWYKKLDKAQRGRFNDLVQTNQSEKSREWPSGPYTLDDQGVPDGLKPVAPVSAYGQSTIEEAFAEAFTHYILGLNMNRDQAESFKSVLVKQAAAVVTPRAPLR